MGTKPYVYRVELAGVGVYGRSRQRIIASYDVQAASLSHALAKVESLGTHGPMQGPITTTEITRITVRKVR